MDIQFCAVSSCGRTAQWALMESNCAPSEPYLCDRCLKSLAGKDADLSARYTAIEVDDAAPPRVGLGATAQPRKPLVSAPGYSTVLLPGSPAEQREKERLAAFQRQKAEQDMVMWQDKQRRHEAWLDYRDSHRERLEREEAARSAKRSLHWRPSDPCPQRAPEAEGGSPEYCGLCHKTHPMSRP